MASVTVETATVLLVGMETNVNSSVTSAHGKASGDAHRQMAKSAATEVGLPLQSNPRNVYRGIITLMSSMSLNSVERINGRYGKRKVDVAIKHSNNKPRQAFVLFLCWSLRLQTPFVSTGNGQQM